MKLIQSERKDDTDKGPCGMFKFPLYAPELARGAFPVITKDEISHLIHNIPVPN
jgi:hypothetical protein